MYEHVADSVEAAAECVRLIGKKAQRDIQEDSMHCVEVLLCLISPRREGISIIPG